MMKRFVVALALLMLFGMGGQEAAAAAPGDLLLTIPNPDPNLHDCFGIRVAAVGENILVGAPHDNTNGSSAGAAYLFDSTTGLLVSRPGWNGKLYGATAGGQFGLDVAAFGNDLLIGQYLDDIAYRYDGDSGTQLVSYNNPGATGDYFGSTLAQWGDDVLVGAIYADTGNTGAVYRFNAATGVQLPFALPSGLGDQAHFGHAMAISDTHVFVGAPLDNGIVNYEGAVWAFDGASWSKIDNPFPAEYDSFGVSLAVLGDRLVVGAPGIWWGDSPGVAYVFGLDDQTGEWERLLTINNPTPAANELFGASVAIVGNDILIGDYYDDTNGTNAGAAYLFDGDTGELIPDCSWFGENDWDSFGTRVAGVGNKAIVGSPSHYTNGDQPGTVYVFQGVPEPSSLVLLSTAILGFLICGWYRRK